MVSDADSQRIQTPLPAHVGRSITVLGAYDGVAISMDELPVQPGVLAELHGASEAKSQESQKSKARTKERRPRY